MKLIDADALRKRLIKARDASAAKQRYGWEFEQDGWNGAIMQIGCEMVEHPVDAVPVIRCRECVEFRRWDDECGECYDGLADGGMVRADGYCYAAERKKDDIQK